jgi:hypothetical protein
MLQARIMAAGRPWAALAERERGQVRAETRMLLEGGYGPEDVLRAYHRYGARAPMALVGLVRAIGHAGGDNQVPVREEAPGARLPVTWPPDKARQAALEALADLRPGGYRSVRAPVARPEREARAPGRFDELLGRWGQRGRAAVPE